jgi:cholesterol transport system auxiliary component
MMRLMVALLAPLAAGCAAERALPVRYDLDGTHLRVPSEPRFNATIAVPPIQAPRWLRTTALVYRLDYEAPDSPRAYALSQWTAPPSELLTLRLREQISAVNDGFTLARLPEDSDGYRLEVSLESFAQVFPSPGRSLCVVTLTATVVQRDDRVLAEKTFRAERPAPRANAAGAVEGLVDASDLDFRQILTWLRETLPTQQAASR